ncbi:hypothetical protein BWD13_18435 [Leptospira santarosai serovar Grippotyphosa]|nr:hypothetical protein BWD13_18435 [Leptospira santarosai serovar Grippotyphosa]
MRVGSIAKFSGHSKTQIPLLYVMDDPPSFKNIEPDEKDIVKYYIEHLSFIYDNAYYNKLKKRIKINKEKFYSYYEYKGKKYYGEFFDRRLNKENIVKNKTEFERTVNTLFNKLTRNIGKVKYFIGINETIIDILNSGRRNVLKEFQDEKLYRETKNLIISIQEDGILYLKANFSKDKQVERKFAEKDVKARLAILWNMESGNSHECGEPCRSRQKRGKRCEIKTYRGACHFHR